MVAPRPLLAALALVAVASGAAAAPVPVRSGEHPDFTRLVFADGAGRGWDIARPAADGIEVTFDGAPPELDLSGVFDRIPRARLTGLRTDGGQLSLDLGCACEVEVSQIASGHIVIDILDAEVDWQAPAPVRPTTERAGAALPLGLPASNLSFPVLARLVAGEPAPRRKFAS